MIGRRRLVLAIAGAVGVIAILVVIAPENAGPGTLVALHRFLPRLGAPTRDGPDPPASGTFLLVADARTPPQEEVILTWVERGGNLVVTDPGSALFGRFGVTSSRVGVFGTTTVEPGCVRPETVGVGRLEISAVDGVLSAPAAGHGCFSLGAKSYALFVPYGRGKIVLVGGSSFMTDHLLNHADNAVFAEALLGEGPVVFGPPAPPDASASVWQVLPSRAKVAVWELVVAALVFALARGRRLGRPIPEEPLSPIPSGELVHATARLYRRARAAAFCGDEVRRWTADRLARQLGVSPDTDRHRLAGTIARSAGADVSTVERALAGREPASDEELVALCRELEAISRQIEGARR